MIPPHAIICAAAFVLAFSNTLSFHATPFYAFDHLAGDARMSGNFGAMQSIAYAVMSLVSSQLVTRAKHGLNIAIVGVVLFAITYGAVPFISVPWPCIFSSAAGLAGMALVWPAIHSWIGAEPDPTARARHMSWLNMSWSGGAAISPLFAGPLYDADFRFPFYGTMALSVVVVVLLRSMPHESSHFAEAPQELLDARADHDRAAIPFLWPAWLGVFAFNALNSALRLIYPKRIEELVETGELRWLFEAQSSTFLSHNPATIFSILAFALSFGTAAAFYIMGRTTAWKHRFSSLFWPHAAAMLALFVLAGTKSVVLMTLAFGVVAAGLGVCFFNASYYCMTDPALKHRRAAINEGMVGSGALLGSFAFGQIAASFGTTLPFLWAPVGIAALVAIQYGALTSARRRKP